MIAATAAQLIMGMFAAVYLRVSTLGQVDGTSLDTQRTACVEKAQSLGYGVKSEHIYRETVTGAHLERPDLSRLRAAAAAGEFSALFVYGSDRLSRDPLDLLNLLAEMARHNVTVYYVQGVYENSPEGQLIQFITGYGHGQEKAQFKERSLRGKIGTALRGKMPTRGGGALFGYDEDEEAGKRVVNNEEAAVVQRVFVLRLSMSTFGICCLLNEEGFLSKTGVKWTGNTLGRMLTNRDYLGESFYNKTRTVRFPDGTRKTVDRDPSEWIPLDGYTPQIVSRELFEAVQEKLRESSTRGHPDPTDPHYLLTSFIKCGRCRSSVCGFGGNVKYRYYRCTESYAKANRPKLCGGGGINVDWLDGKVWGCVVATLQSPNGIIADLLSNVAKGGGDLGEEKRRVEAELKRLHAEEMRIAALSVKGLFQEEILESQMTKLILLREDLRLKLKELVEQERLVEEASEIEGRIRSHCERLREGVDDLDFNGKRQVLAALGIQVYATKEDWWMTGVIDPGFLVNVPISICRKWTGLPSSIRFRAWTPISGR